MDAGFYRDISMADYIADPCVEPSLSTAVVADLIYRSPRHARVGHPRLWPVAPDRSPRADVGSAVHSLALGGQDVVYADPQFRDWKKGAAQEFRDAAYAANQIPLLAHQQNSVEAAALEARSLLARVFGTGDTEVTMLWRHDGVWCRGRADYLPHDAPYDVDIKTTDNADPKTWARYTVKNGHLDIQGGLRGLGHLALGKPRATVWLLVEISGDAHGCSLVGMDPALEALARRKVDKAAEIWRRCLDEKNWPSYRDEIHWLAPSAYDEAELDERTKQ